MLSIVDSSRLDDRPSLEDPRRCSSPDDSERSHSPRSVSDPTRRPTSPVDASRRPASTDSSCGSELATRDRLSPAPRDRLSPSHTVKTEREDEDRRSYDSSERRSPCSPDSTPQSNAPNVTVIQPSVNHPMLSYLYQTGLYSAPHPMSFPVSPMMFNSGAAMAAAAAAAAAHGSGLPGIPFLPSSLPGSDVSSHFPPGAAACLAGRSGMMLNNPLAMAAGHSLWQQTYAAALCGHGSAQFDPSSSSTIPSAFGPLFAPRSLHSAHRFAPYAFPYHKSSPSSTSPLAAHGLRSPIVDLSRPVSPDSRYNMPSPAHSSPGSVSSRGSGAPRSELKNIERMVSGLERRHERLVSDK